VHARRLLNIGAACPRAGEQIRDRIVDVAGEHVHVGQQLGIGIDAEAGLTVDRDHADGERMAIGERDNRARLIARQPDEHEGDAVPASCANWRTSRQAATAAHAQ
jgi:hypothetical protein